MIKSENKILAGLCILVIILAVIYASVYALGKYFFSATKIKNIVTTQLSNSLNRSISIADDVGFSIDWNLTPHIILKDVKIANSEWSKQGPMLTIKELDLNFSLIKALFKEYRIVSLSLVEPNLLLETQGDNKNWQFGDSSEADDSKLNLVADQIMIENGKLTIIENNAKPTILKIDDLEFETSISTNAFSINIAKFKSGTSDINGKITIKHDPLEIKGNIYAKQFAPSDFFASSQGNTGPYHIPNTAIPVEELRKAKINVQVQVDHIAINKLPIDNFDAVLFIKDNVITFDLSHPAKIANGTLDLDFDYDLKPKIPTLTMLIKTSELDFATLLSSMFDKSPLNGSKFQFSSNLKSNGTTLNKLVANLSGNMLATAGPGEFINTSSGVTNLFTNILSSLITFNKQQSSTGFTCGVVNFRINNGIAVAQNGIGLEAATVNVLGSGQLNLNNGTINFNITPENLSKNPVNIAQYSIAQSVQITGTITDPKVSFNPLDIISAQSATKIASEVVGGALTGGLGVIAGSVLGGNASTKIVNPCKTARSG